MSQATGLISPLNRKPANSPPYPECLTHTLHEVDLAKAGIISILWATGFALDFNWLKAASHDAKGTPLHTFAVSAVPGLNFLGLAWRARRASPLIWRVWHDAAYLADHIAAHR